MAAPASFHDTTRLTQKTRSRGSLHDLFGLSPPEPLQINIPGPAGQTFQTPVNRRKTIVRPTEPPPPPPLPVSAGLCITVGSPESDETAGIPPVAPPRRVYRHSKADSDSLTRASSVKSSSDTPSVPVTPTPVPTLDLSPGVTSWAGRPLSGQVKVGSVRSVRHFFNFLFYLHFFLDGELDGLVRPSRTSTSA